VCFALGAAITLIATLLVGCGAQRTINAPDVVGLRLDAAHRKFEKLGVDDFEDRDVRHKRTPFRDHSWVVIRQSPAAGTTGVGLDSKIVLTVGKYSDHDILDLIPAESTIAQELRAKQEKADKAKEEAAAKEAAAKAAEAALAATRISTRLKAKSFFDDMAGSVDWKKANTPEGRPRYLGIVSDTLATIELFGAKNKVDEIAYQAVFDGTDPRINLARALPGLQMVQKFVSERAAKFVADQLDDFSTYDAIPQRRVLKRYGRYYVRVLGIDVINTVNIAISIGHRPSD